MNRDLKGQWQHLKSELHHLGTVAADDLDWIDASHDYTRGQVKVLHAPRGFRAQHRAEPMTAHRRR